MFGRYSFSPTLVFDPPSLGAAGGDATNGGQPGRAPGFTKSAAIGGTYAGVQRSARWFPPQRRRHVVEWRRGVDMNLATVRMPSDGFYARDMWQITRKLTVVYGMRCEVYPVPRRDHWAGERYDSVTDKVVRGGFDTGHGQIAPRLGIAYRINERTGVLTGAGISVDPNTFRYLRDAYPATISTQYSGANSHQPAGTLRTGFPM
ncbi:MAG: TonB-dependent receptor [Acidobacteria bacterium]|nr:TonB-dependent receptor [Acidobacteriota bacterium]